MKPWYHKLTDTKYFFYRKPKRTPPENQVCHIFFSNYYWPSNVQGADKIFQTCSLDSNFALSSTFSYAVLIWVFFFVIDTCLWDAIGNLPGVEEHVYLEWISICTLICTALANISYRIPMKYFYISSQTNQT